MTKVSVDSKIWSEPRFEALRLELNLTKVQAVGLLVLMWHDTRAGDLLDAGYEDIAELLPCTPSAREPTIGALCSAGYLDGPGGSGRYRIIDNEEYLDLTLRRRQWGKLRGTKNLVGVAAPAPEKPAVPTKQTKKAKPKPDSEATAANKCCWAAYHDAYRKRWGVDPARNAKVNGQIAQFVQRVGREVAPEIMRFYVEHNDGLYVRNMHQVSFALRDAEALQTQWSRGAPITTRDVVGFERMEGVSAQLSRIQAGEV